MDKRIIIALDLEDLGKAKEIIRRLEGRVSIYKIGLTLFLNYGYEAIKEVKNMGYEVFLDLKLFDIPHQTAGACRKIVEMGVGIFTCHTLGGREMLQTVAGTTREYAEKRGVKSPEIFGVTILTSLDQKNLDEIGIGDDLKDESLKLALLADKSGLDGVVSSPLELGRLRKELRKDFMIMTPGIRLENQEKGDQKRVMTPGEAFKAGASYIVIGRPVTQAKRPEREFDRIMNQ